MTRRFPKQPIPPAIAALALAVLAQWPPVALGQATQAVHYITVLPGETVPAAMRRALREEGLARRGLAPLPVGQKPTGSVAPKILTGTIVSPSVNVTVPVAAPAMQFTFHAPSLWQRVLFEFTSPHGQIVDEIYEPQYPSGRTGTATFQDLQGSLGLYAEPGAWALTHAEIDGPDGANTTYDQAQLAAIFPSPTFMVINPGQADITPPTVSSGKILTPLVHVQQAGAHFSAKMTVADDVSGVTAAYLYIAQKQSGIAVRPSPILPAPILNGPVLLTLPSSSLSLQGPYSIVAYGALDVAGNLFLDQNASDIKATFGNPNFRVEN